MLRKSRAASTREARTDRELVRTITAIFPARRTAFATRLIYTAIITTRLPLSAPSSSGVSTLVAFDPSFPPFPSKSGVSSSGSLYNAFGVLLTLPTVLWPFPCCLSVLPPEVSASSERGLEGSSDIVCGMAG